MVTPRDREDIQHLMTWEDGLEILWSVVEDSFHTASGQKSRDSDHLREATYDLDLAVLTLNRLLSGIRNGSCQALPQETRSSVHEAIWRVWALVHDARERAERVRQAITPEDEEPLDFQAEQEQRRRHEQFWMNPAYPPSS